LLSKEIKKHLTDLKHYNNNIASIPLHYSMNEIPTNNIISKRVAFRDLLEKTNKKNSKGPKTIKPQ